MFAHLHVHSYYSLLEGLDSPEDLVQAAVGLEMPALALTDHHLLSGSIEFYSACLKSGVKPIVGLEVDVALPQSKERKIPEFGTLVFLAMDNSGWKNLCRISSAIFSIPGGQDNFLSFERLVDLTDGLICLTGGDSGYLSKLHDQGKLQEALSWIGLLREIFPDRLYIELQFNPSVQSHRTTSLLTQAQAVKVPVVSTYNIYYISPQQFELQKVVTAIRNNVRLTSVRQDELAPNEAFFISREEFVKKTSPPPEAMAAIGEIIDRCNLELPLGKAHFPEISTPPGVNPMQLLRQKAENGAMKIYGNITPEIRQRLDHEFNTIGNLGYASLFLIVEEILSFARRTGVPFSSRGSAASSLVAHCLGITSPDPLSLNLYFERFLNPARVTYPDIDLDLCSRRRDEVINFVYQKYGRERVAMVCTVNRFRRRSVLREVAKAHGLQPSEISPLADSLPERWYGPPERKTYGAEPFAEISPRFPSPLHQSIFRDATALIGLPHHLSIHPGGLVISPGHMTDLAPTLLAAKGVTITQFDLESIEQLGMVKIDLLGIRGLTVIGDVVDSINSSASQLVHDRLGILEEIAEDDPQTSEIVRTGRTIGCFQIESPGMRATLREIQASTQQEVMAALALYRPGPLTGGQKDDFIRRFKGLEPTAYLHPALAPLLEDTYGIILYQEQVLRIAHQLAGLSLADADLLRRAMSHFDPGKQMQTLKEKFIAGTDRLHGIPENTAERIWELMAAFAGYGFPKAHAASYAQVAWRSAWCKAHHPAIFIAAVLANWGGYYSQNIYLTEARRLGLDLKPPHINYAQPEFSVSYLEGMPVLYMGLDQVRDLSARTQKRILGNRPFKTFEDFLTRADPRPQEAENLVKVGALEGMGTIPALLRRLTAGGWKGGQLSLFAPSLSNEEDYSLLEKAEAQEMLLGVSVIAHRLEIFHDLIAASHAISTLDAAASLGQQVRVAGTRQFLRRTGSSRGETSYVMTLEDLEGMLPVLISSDVYRRCRSELRRRGPYIVEGVMSMNLQQNEAFMRAERIWAVSEVASNPAEEIPSSPRKSVR